jgi:hypothetical protein
MRDVLELAFIAELLLLILASSVALWFVNYIFIGQQEVVLLA